MLKVVIDTNVLVSSLLSSGPPAVIVDLIADAKIAPFYNDLILCEYFDVLSREKFGFSNLQLTRLIEDIVRTGIAVENAKPSVFAMIDEDDRIFYDTAVGALAYLITGNKKHFPLKSFVLTPIQFLAIYQENN